MEYQRGSSRERDISAHFVREVAANVQLQEGVDTRGQEG